MECGVPFCHDGCPLGNLIPDWNDLVYQGRWREAIEQLHATNDFPEWTGLICPAPCEPACVLAINDDPVVDQADRARDRRARVGGGLDRAAAARVAARGRTRRPWSAPGPRASPPPRSLNRAGHAVVVYERDEGPGGLLRFGVPDFKLEKWYIDRRVAVLEAEGIGFAYGVDVGADLPRRRAARRATTRSCSRSARACTARSTCPAPTCAACASRWTTSTRATAGSRAATAEGDDPELTAAGKHVVVIGGGDTAMDCVGNAHREDAASVTVLDTYPAPPGPAARDSVPVARRRRAGW